MAIDYTTKEGERVDQIANQLFGQTKGLVESIYATNKGLADEGAELPAGIVIKIEEPNESESTEVVQLWQ